MRKMTTAADLDVDLLAALRTHHARYSPFYQGSLSDHGPMGALALHGLGKPEPEVRAWLDDYHPLIRLAYGYQFQIPEEITAGLACMKWCGRDEPLETYFFALHLVTGSHAFRVLYPFAGELRDEIFTLGILAGYASSTP